MRKEKRKKKKKKKKEGDEGGEGDDEESYWDAVACLGLAIELFGATFISWCFVSSPWFRRFHHTPISVLPHMPFFPLNTYTPVITKKDVSV